MPVSEDDLKQILTQELGREVTDEEIQDFLHEHYTYEVRIGMHDVINCDRCRKETRVG